MLRALNEKNNQSRFAGRISTGADSYSLNTGLFHPFIRVLGSNFFRAHKLLLRDGIDELRSGGRSLELNAFCNGEDAFLREELSFNDARANSFYLGRQIRVRLPFGDE